MKYIVREVKRSRSDVAMYAADTMAECIAWAVNYLGTDSINEDFTYIKSNMPAVYLNNAGSGRRLTSLCVMERQSWHDLSQIV